ncbi:hypothetical protein FHW20_002589 [Ochrobactrum intermedium]|uniref:Uncharacterized protein n=1 Tax=Brucella intermedia TaxID=94625 RepID=A0ABR6AQ99_9HYPH|nr:hypothetical protein [Brucella intermedia]NYD83139.1 hypothetical protein [Brucella intermedia]
MNPSIALSENPNRFFGWMLRTATTALESRTGRSIRMNDGHFQNSIARAAQLTPEMNQT